MWGEGNDSWKQHSTFNATAAASAGANAPSASAATPVAPNHRPPPAPPPPTGGFIAVTERRPPPPLPVKRASTAPLRLLSNQLSGTPQQQGSTREQMPQQSSSPAEKQQQQLREPSAAHHHQPKPPAHRAAPPAPPRFASHTGSSRRHRGKLICKRRTVTNPRSTSRCSASRLPHRRTRARVLRATAAPPAPAGLIRARETVGMGRFIDSMSELKGTGDWQVTAAASAQLAPPLIPHC